MIQQPSTYPLPQYRAQLVARWHYVLTGMVQMGNLTAQQAADAEVPGRWATTSRRSSAAMSGTPTS